MADPDEDGDVEEYLRRAATERPRLSDEERSAQVERQYATRRDAQRLWWQVVRAFRGIP